MRIKTGELKQVNLNVLMPFKKNVSFFTCNCVLECARHHMDNAQILSEDLACWGARDFGKNGNLIVLLHWAIPVPLGSGGSLGKIH